MSEKLQKENSSKNELSNKGDITFLYDNLKNLIYKNYSIYFVLSDTSETYLLYNDKTNKSYLFSKQKLHQFLTIEYKKQFNILFEIKVKDMYNYLIDENLIKNIYDLGFKPINQKEFIYNNNKYLNTFEPSEYLIKSNFEEYKGNFLEYLNNNSPNILYLISNLCNFKKEQVNYFIHWLSYKVQKPYDKITRGIVFYGDESTGKGLLFDTIIKEIFQQYSYLSNMKFYDPKSNQSNYNGHESKLIINAVDECYYLPSVEDTLKNKITQKNKLINVKGGKQIEEQDFEDMLFFSNRELPIKAGDKRLSFIKSKKLKGDENKASEWVVSEYLPNYKKELKYLLNVFHHLEVEEKIIRNNLKNKELEDIKDQTKSLEEKFIDLMKDYSNLSDMEEDLIFRSKKKNTTHILEFNNEYVSLNSIYNLYDLFLLSIGYEKKALNKNQLLKYLEVDTENKTEYKKLKFNKKSCYCIPAEKLVKFFEETKTEQEEKEDYLESITIGVD